MPSGFILILSLCTLLSIGYIFFALLSYRISLLEKRIIQIFQSRSDTIPALFEVSQSSMSRHGEIFKEVLHLRKQEFSLISVSESLEGIIKIEQFIHHEINFIFQVCNKHPKLAKKKEFLYIRDVILEKSSNIATEMKKYKKIVEIYNKLIRVKNYTLIGFILPFSKKAVL